MAISITSYWRSSAAFRVRIALNLKGLSYETIPVDLIKQGGEQFAPGYLKENPNALVPILKDGNHTLHQSLAIIEYLEETHPHPPLLPQDALGRATVRSLALDIAADIHPLNNVRVLRYLKNNLHIEEPVRDQWYRHWLDLGFSAMEKRLARDPQCQTFCFKNQPTLADICLVPQLYNARSIGLDMKSYPTLMNIFSACMELPAFIDASWENQMDAPQ